MTAIRLRHLALRPIRAGARGGGTRPPDPPAAREEALSRRFLAGPGSAATEAYLEVPVWLTSDLIEEAGTMPGFSNEAAWRHVAASLLP